MSDTIFATNNQYEIPLLQIDMAQPRVDLPLRAWGSASRQREARGAWHFYVDDYRFSRLIASPELIDHTAPTYACELNISVTNQTPEAIAIYATYRKRYASRTWQESGIPIVVDLNVAPRYADLNLMGVPDGWPTFSTRGDRDTVRDDYEIAKSKTANPNLIVIGGGKAVRQICCELPGAVYLESFRTQTSSSEA